jgi:plastocyanin
LALLTLVGGPLPGGAQFTPPGSPHVVTVRTVERVPYGIAFEPIRVTVHSGDTVRFVQAGRMMHNVEFRSIPPSASLGSALRGPDLVAPGETYDVVIDDRFPPGKYVYVCVPHEVLGMAGIIYVVERD